MSFSVEEHEELLGKEDKDSEKDRSYALNTFYPRYIVVSSYCLTQ